jgi:catechol 2,3-dioxygenase-like lactoylglutathione lyase family enzyme
MKNALMVILLFGGSLLYGQTAILNYQPYFSAVVVKKLATSVKWYQSVFDLKLKSEMKDPNQAYHIVILESPNYLLELLELKGSIDKAGLLKDKQDAEMQGHFKIGFKISDASAVATKLKNINIEVPNVWTDPATGKKNFLIQDPDGNLIQFFE